VTFNLKRMQFDEKRSLDGVPLEVEDGITLGVRRAGGHNRSFQFALAKLVEDMDGPLSEQPAEVQYRTMRRAAAETLVAWWEGIEEDGVAVPCEPDVIERLFTAIPDLYEEVLGKSMDEEAYRLEADTKSVR